MSAIERSGPCKVKARRLRTGRSMRTAPACGTSACAGAAMRGSSGIGGDSTTDAKAGRRPCNPPAT
ncbi:hypothetical protein D3C72_2187900 [compost metagenome]